jgi:hypothetical protein
MIGKIQLPFLAQFHTANLLGVSAETRAENSVGGLEMIRTPMQVSIDQKMLAIAWLFLHDATA